MQHNVQWIAPGLPGAGDLIVMNDGDYRTPVLLYQCRRVDAAGNRYGRLHAGH